MHSASRAALVGLLLTTAGPAWADPRDSLDPAARQHYDTALAAEASGRPKRAAAAWRLVLASDPAFEPAVLGLGRAQLAMGDEAAAAKTWSRLSTDPDAVEALARLVEDEDPERAAALYRRLTTLRLGDPDPHRLLARVLASSEPEAAADELELWLGMVSGTTEGEGYGETMVAVAQALRDAGDEERARGLLERYLLEWPEGRHADEVHGRLDRMAVEIAARELAVGASQALSAELRARVEGARRRAAAGQLEPALAELREVVQAAPRAAEAWGALGDVHRLLGRVDEAERAYAWAAALAPDEATWHARLGLLLADRYGGRRDREADELLSRALALRPGWAELAWRQGEVRQALQDWDGAAAAYRQYLELDPDGAFATDARQRVADLERAPPAPAALPSTAPPPTDLPTEAVEHYRIARVYWDQGQLDESRAELEQSLALAPDWTAGLNLRAALDMSAGDEEAAVAAWRRSLELDPAQPLVLLNLGDRLRRAGQDEQARALLQAAAEGGAGDAWVLLAQMAWEEHRLWQARRYLDHYAATPSVGMGQEAASGLRQRVEQRIRLVQAGVGGLSGLLVVGGLGLVLRRRSGKPLSALLAQAPEVSHDLARLLSAIRHEVIKHNTTLLDEVADALDNGDHHAVRWAAIQLFGPRRGSSEGVVARFDGYLKAVERLGRTHGVRLDLRRNDPTLAPMWAAMRRLRRLEPALRRPEGARAALAEELRELSVILNQRGYRQLGERVREMGSLRLSADILAAVDERVRGEPGFEGVALPALDLRLPEGPPVPVKVFRGDLDDIVANLLRNAYRAVVADLDDGLRRVGITVREEEDPITGLEQVLIEVRDNAAGQLTDALIHSRGIGRGLGLVVDLVTRHDGSIRVATLQPGTTGYTKAVVVQLPRADLEPEA